MGITIVVLYVIAMLLIGYVSIRRTKTVGDFFIGNRSLGPWMSAFAYGTTYFSAVLFVGYAGKLGWGFGLHTMWIVVGNAVVGSLLAWAILAAPTRRMTARLKAMTLPEFLGARYGSRFLKAFAAVIIFVFLVPYSSSVYMGLGYLFEKILGLDYTTALVFVAALTGVYLAMGGYFAIAISDFARGIVELFGVIVMVLFLTAKKGGFIAATAALAAPGNAPGLATKPGQIPGWLTLASLVLITSFGPWAMPQMVQKFYSIRSTLDIKRAMTIAFIFSVFIAFGAYYTGALTHLFFTNDTVPKLASGGVDFDAIMPQFILGNTPSAVAMIILLLILSASMSSLSSLVLVSSAAISVDLMGAVQGEKSKARQSVGAMRVLCLLFVGVSLWIAMNKVALIVELMVISWGLLAGAFLAPFLYGIFWKGATKAGAIASAITGVGISIGVYLVYGFTHAPTGEMAAVLQAAKASIPLAGAISMLLPLIVMPVVSSLTAKRPAEEIDRAFGAADETEAEAAIAEA
jgi:SSS family transporter